MSRSYRTTQGCDHEFDTPLYAQDETGWTDRQVGVMCGLCYHQLFDGDPPLVWTGTSNKTIETAIEDGKWLWTAYR